MLRSLCLVLTLASAAMPALAQEAYPSKPVTLIVPYPAGGPMDKLARELAEALRPQLRQPVVIQNLSGSGGNLGTAIAMRTPADGYTLLLNHISMATSPALYRTLGFKPDADFEPLGVFVESPLVLVARPQVKAGSVVELIRWIATQPQVKLANAGPGSASHLCGLLVQSSLKISMTTVPYRGTAPAMTDLLGGHVDLMCDLTANAIPHVQAAKLKPVAVTSAKPLLGTPLAGVPTMARLGIADVELSIWYGLYAPKGTPPAIQQQVNEALARAIRSDAFGKAQAAAGIQLVSDSRLTPAGHREFLRSELARWNRVIKAAGVYAD
jgi:tripartite-type tricarboxylate transporter receptor subunit TctC